MDELLPILLIGCMGAAVIIIAVAMVRAKRRTAAFKRVADDLGLSFLGKDHYLFGRFPHLRLFSQGHSRRMKNVLTGNSGEIEINVGDYSYISGSGQNSQEHTQTVCILQSGELDTPQCFLRPESRLFDFLGGLFGGLDIDFDDDPEFSGAYVLQGESENAIRGLFDPSVRAWFVDRRRDNLHFEACGNVLVFHTGRRVPPGQTRDLMQQALEIRKLLGQHQGEQSDLATHQMGSSE